MCLCEYVHMRTGGQKKVLALLELEVHVAVSHLIWVLGIELRPPVRALSALKYCSISLIHRACMFWKLSLV